MLITHRPQMAERHGQREKRGGHREKLRCVFEDEWTADRMWTLR